MCSLILRVSYTLFPMHFVHLDVHAADAAGIYVNIQFVSSIRILNKNNARARDQNTCIFDIILHIDCDYCTHTIIVRIDSDHNYEHNYIYTFHYKGRRMSSSLTGALPSREKSRVHWTIENRKTTPYEIWDKNGSVTCGKTFLLFSRESRECTGRS